MAVKLDFEAQQKWICSLSPSVHRNFPSTFASFLVVIGSPWVDLLSPVSKYLRLLRGSLVVLGGVCVQIGFLP